ncbi:GNAT family N-acetyltransferase [Methylopila musalis]|uniref:GNAT family N-acetyltransferase n=1 Tax=Methylopila musalis TaxID=1134781 RepID=A0ABW3Z666_9HYPH
MPPQHDVSSSGPSFAPSLFAEDCLTASPAVRLRRLAPADAPAIAEGLSDFEVARNLGRVPHPYTLADAEAWFAGPAQDPDALRAGLSVNGALAGMVSLDPVGGAMQLGYWLAKPFWGRGIATQAVGAFVDFAFAATRLGAVEALHMVDNPASGRLLRRLGFAPCGVTRERSLARRATVEHTLSRLTRADWTARQPAIETARLSLRTPTTADVEETARLPADRPVGLATAQTAAMIGQLDEARAFILRAAREPRPANLRLLMRLKETGALVGTIGWRAAEPGVVDLGFWLGVDHRGRGLMTEAARAAIEAAFRWGAADAVRTSCRATDWATRQVIIRCGFQWEGSGLVRPTSGGPVAADQFRLDRDTFLSFREWTPAAFHLSAG